MRESTPPDGGSRAERRPHSAEQARSRQEQPQTLLASSSDSEGFPDARVVRRRAWATWAWTAPLLALIAIGALVTEAVRQRGLPVTVTFANGRGLSADDPVNCRGVQVGVVERVRLSDDLNAVVAHLRLYPDGESLAAEGAQFWIVRPEVTLRGVTGLDALLGPRYIEVAPPVPGAVRRAAFIGLESPPRVREQSPGALEVILLAARRGSISIGSPITYRDMRVGSVLEIRLTDDSTRVEVVGGIESAYATLVRDNSRFWNASGVGVDFGLFGGLTVRADSLEAILTGGIAFATPSKKIGEQVQSGHRFDLAPEVNVEWLTWDPVLPRDPSTVAAGSGSGG